MSPLRRCSGQALSEAKGLVFLVKARFRSTHDNFKIECEAHINSSDNVNKSGHASSASVLRRRLPFIYVWGLGTLLVVLAGGLLWWMLDAMALQSRNDLAGLLTSRVRVSHEFVRAWAAERERDVTILSTSEELRHIIEELLAVPHSRDLLAASPAQARLRRFLSSIIIERGFLGFSIIAPDLIYLSSSPEDNIGKVAGFAYQGDLLTRVFQDKPARAFSIQLNSSSSLSEQTPLYVIGPIYNGKREVVAVLVFHLDPVADLSKFAQLGNFGRTAETYAFDRGGRFLTESRFASQLRQTGQLGKDQSRGMNREIRNPGGNLLEGFKPALARSQWPFTLAVENAIQGRSGVNLGAYRDYRGVPVVGAWIWDANLEFGLVTEIDMDEAYQGFYSTRRLVATLFLLTVTMFLVFSAVLTKALNRTLKSADAIQRSETFLRTVLDTTAISMIMIDRRGIIRSFNKSAENMFGYTLDEVIGRNISLLMPEPYCSQHDEYLENYLATGLAKIIGIGRETLARHKSGTVFPIVLSVSEVRFGGDVTFIGAIQDLTERKRMEMSLVRARDNLESRVERRTEELNLINEELKNFAYIVSHDLRSPLVNLKGFTAELGACLRDIQSVFERVWLHVDKSAKQKVTNIFQNDVPEALGFINSSVSRMDNLINAVLKLSRLGRKEMDLQTVNVEGLVKKILAAMAYQIKQGHMRIMVGLLPEVIGDPIAIDQIFSNILSNAVHYLEPGRIGVIQVSAETGADETTFHIQDNGRGIADNDMDKIFEIFRRAGKQDVPGEGMGLAYVKTLVRRHGGRIWCESEPGLGSTFSFTIANHIEQYNAKP